MALTKVKNVLDITADTMVDLLSAKHKKGSVQLLGYHERGDGGGGVFYWDADKPKTEHNGGTVVDPTVSFPNDWSDTAQQELWFTAPTSGTGCWVREFSGAVNVKWFGAKGDGVSDDTVSVNSCVVGFYHTHFPEGVFKTKYIRTGSEAKKITGEGNKHLYLKGSSGITLSEVETLGGTWIYGTSTTVPAISCNTSVNGTGGLWIEGLCFYQDHIDYSTPTVYQPCISDQESSGFWSGVTVKDIMMINCFKGIELTKAERTDISDVNMDAFHKGIYIAISRDVSKMERIHMWNFSQSALAASYKQSLASDWSIHLNDCDEIFISDVFVWDRYYGILSNNVWGTLDGYTADAVGKPLVVSSPKGFASNYNDLKINCNNPIQHETVIEFSGTAGSTSSVNLSKVSFWQGSAYTFGADNGVVVNCADLILNIDNINPKIFRDSGVRIANAEYVKLDGFYCSNFIANQEPTVNELITVGIRNTSTAKVVLRNISSNLLRFIYDGYYENVTFDNALSVYEEKFTASSSGCTVTSTPSSRYISVTESVGDGTASFSGMRAVPYNRQGKTIIAGEAYIAGVLYDTPLGVTLTTPGDYRMVSMPRVGTQEVFIPLTTEPTGGVKLVVTTFIANSSGNLTAGPFARNYTGSYNFYASYITEGSMLTGPNIFKEASSVSSSIPTSTQNYWPIGHKYYNSTPTASGFIGWMCVAAGSPGTWKEFGTISA